MNLQEVYKTWPYDQAVLDLRHRTPKEQPLGRGSWVLPQEFPIDSTSGRWAFQWGEQLTHADFLKKECINI